MSFDFASLITTRTKDNVQRATSMNGRDFDSLSASEQTEYLASLNGAYNVSDLDRVGLAVQALTEELLAAGIRVETSPKTDWAASDIPTETQMAQYLADVAAIRAALQLPSTAPETPESMHGLTWQSANNIETILSMVERSLAAMALTLVPCGDGICGGDYL